MSDTERHNSVQNHPAPVVSATTIADRLDAAKWRIQRVAHALTCTAVASLLVTVALFGYSLLNAWLNWPADPVQQKLQIINLCTLFGDTCFFVLVIYACHHVRHMKKYEWAILAALMTIVSLFCLSVLGVVQGIVGIWALCILCQADVRMAFQTSNPKPASSDYKEPY